jgi:hypothetical protein
MKVHEPPELTPVGNDYITPATHWPPEYELHLHTDGLPMFALRNIYQAISCATIGLVRSWLSDLR